SGGKLRDGNQHRRSKNAQKICAKPLAPDFAIANERRLLALPRLHPAFKRRDHRRQGSVCSTQHRLVQRPQPVLFGGRPSGYLEGNRLHKKIRRQERTPVISNGGGSRRCGEKNQCRLRETLSCRSQCCARSLRSRNGVAIGSRGGRSIGGPRKRLTLGL